MKQDEENEDGEVTGLTTEQELIDCRKEIKALREAISDAWREKNKTEEALREALRQLAEQKDLFDALAGYMNLDLEPEPINRDDPLPG